MTYRDDDMVSTMNDLAQTRDQSVAGSAASRQVGRYCGSCGKPIAVAVELCPWCGMRQLAFGQCSSYGGGVRRDAVRQGSSTRSTAKLVAVGSGLAMVGGFFLPWISTFGLHISGWDLINLLNTANAIANTVNPDQSGQSGGAVAAFLLWCILLAGICGLGAAVWGGLSAQRRMAPWICTFIAGMVGLLPFVLVALGLEGLSHNTQSGASVGMSLASNFVSVDMGVWLTVAGALGLIAQACVQFRHQEASSPTAALRQL